MLKGRLEDQRMLTGRGRYVSDWNLPGQVYAHFLRSDRAHAEIVSIDKAPALQSPGALAVFTGEDLAGLKSLPAALPVKGRGGAELINPGRPALARGKVRFAGDAVAMVVAESASAAQDAAERIAVEYRDLATVVSAQEAVAPGAPLVHEAVPGNLVLDYESGDEAKTRSAFEDAARIVKLSLDNSRVVGNPMEPRACSSARNTSERVPVHFTGRPSCFAANSAAQYSGYRLKRTPKPPPTSSAMTRILSGGTPSTAESWLRMLAAP